VDKAHRFSDWEYHLRNSEWLAEELAFTEDEITAVTCKSDMMFQIVHCSASYESTEFGSWSKGLPDPNCFLCLVDLNFAGATVMRLQFAHLDGMRYFVPIPKLRSTDDVEDVSGAVEYYYDSNSLDFLIGKVIGEFYISDSLEGFAHRQGIKIL